MLASLLLQVVLSAASPPRELALWLLEHNERQPAERALLEALRIYTRDIDVPITIRRIPAGLATEDAQVEFARLHCASQANLVAWWNLDNSALRVLDCANNSEERLPVYPDDELPVTVQTLALKVRGLLADALAARKKTRLPEPAVPEPTQTPIPLPANVAPATRVILSEPAQAKMAPPKVIRTERGVELGAGYLMGALAGVDGWRQGVGVRLGLVFSSLPAVLEVDGAITSLVSHRSSHADVTVRDIPFAVTFSPRLERGKWLFSAGVRAGVHVLTVEGRSVDGRSGGMQSSSFAAGTVEQIRCALWPRLAVNLSFINEAILPSRRITLDGREGLRVGPFQWNLFLGLVARM